MAATEQINMNGVAAETTAKPVRRRTKKATAPNAAESKGKSTSILLNKLMLDEKANLLNGSDTSLSDTSTVCNGIVKTEADVTPNTTPKSSKLVDSLSEVVNVGVTASSPANVVLICPPSTAPKIVEPSKNSKLYVLNGNVLKEVNDVDKVKPEKVNYMCVTANNLGDVIKKIQSGNVKNGKPPVSSGGEADGDKSKLLSTLPTFFQLSHPALKGASNPKIAFTVSPTIVTKSSTNNGDILRSKLLENALATGQPASKTKGVKIASATTKESVADSPAVAKARSELVRCRKALIEAAIHPQLPTYAPPAYYTGPTYSCEECEDTFASPEGLSKHKNRRSVLFTYACPVCKKTLEFYSRCTFLLHVRSHDVAVKACFLTISIIPASKLNFAVLDGQLHRNEVESAPLFDPAADDRCSPTGDKGASDASSQSHHIVPIYRKRRATSPLQNVDDSSFDDEVVAVDRLPSGSSSDDVTAVEGGDQSNAVSIPKATRKRASYTSKQATADASTTNCTPTTATPCDSASGRSTPASTPGASPASPQPAGSPFDEIRLTSSDEEEAAAPPEEPKNHWIPCRECHQEVPSLTRHYRAANRPLRDFPCEQCKFFNPSACALAAHKRMHTRSVPYICPDCGFYFSTLDSFLIHVKQVCFYDYKTIRFKCPQCSLLKPSVPLFTEHLKQRHIREVFKCSVCITSAYSARTVQAHMERVHPEATPTVLEGYRCMLCPNMLVAKQSIGVHVKKHVYGLQHLRYVYICKFCKKYASGRMSKFEAHYRGCADRVRDASPSRQPPKRATARRSPEKRAPSAEKDPLSVEEWEADRLKADFGPMTKCCVMCRTTKLTEHSKSLFCNACVSYVNAPDSGAGPADGAFMGAAKKAEGAAGGRSKRKLKCTLCKQLLNRDWSTITDHYLRHHHTDFDVGVKSKAPEGAASRKRKSSTPKQETVATTPTCSGNSGALATSTPVSAAAVSLVPAKVPKVECKYRCVKCGFSTNVRNDFHEHIVSHKKQSNTNYQCLECGECFIVKPSLEKHLIVVHQVRDVAEYDKDNRMVGGGSDDDADDESKERAVAENQCEVCYMECDSKQQYDRHIRTHGMAFVAMQSRAKS